MSKLYSIQESTLTDIGDALRDKYGETRLEMISVPCVIAKSSNVVNLDVVGTSKAGTEYVVARIPGATKIEVNLYYSTQNWAKIHIASGEYQSNMPQDNEYIGGSPSSWANVQITFDGTEVITFCYTCSAAYLSGLGYYAECIGYDANGNPIEFEGCSYLEKEAEVSNTYSSADVAAAIDGLDPSAVFKTSVDGTMTTITEKNLAGISTLEEYCVYQRRNLTSLELPDEITRIKASAFRGCNKLVDVKMPHNDSLVLENNVFNDCNALKSITLYETPPTVTDLTFDTRYLENIYVPGYAYTDYLSTSYFSSKYRDLLTPNSPFAGQISGKKALLLNEGYEYSIPLLCFDEAPTNYSVSCDSLVSQGGSFAIVNIQATNTEITFWVSASFEGETTIIATIEDSAGTVYTRELAIKSYETLPEATYTVETAPSASYGFALNDAGYYESQNKGIGTSAAVCRVNVNNPAGFTMYVDAISNGEANYDYGILSNVGSVLKTGNTDDGATGSALVKYNFKGLSSTKVVTIAYEDVIGTYHIDIKFRKDGSGDQGNDSLQFKIRFE